MLHRPDMYIGPEAWPHSVTKGSLEEPCWPFYKGSWGRANSHVQGDLASIPRLLVEPFRVSSLEVWSFGRPPDGCWSILSAKLIGGVFLSAPFMTIRIIQYLGEYEGDP